MARECTKEGAAEIPASLRGGGSEAGVSSSNKSNRVGDGGGGSGGRGTTVFFNPIQKLQRDWSVAVLTEFAHERCERQTGEGGLFIADALCGSGVRALRYAMEVPYVARVAANDREPGSRATVSGVWSGVASHQGKSELARVLWLAREQAVSSRPSCRASTRHWRLKTEKQHGQFS